MEDMYGSAISLGDDGGPFQPYVEIEDEEPKQESRQSQSLSVGVEDKSGLKRVAPSDSKCNTMPSLQQEANLPLPTHAYSKVGKILHRTYLRSTICGPSGSGPSAKLPRPSRIPSTA